MNLWKLKVCKKMLKLFLTKVFKMFYCHISMLKGKELFLSLLAESTGKYLNRATYEGCMCDCCASQIAWFEKSI